MHAHIALANGAERYEQRRHIEDVAHALAVRLQQYGKRWRPGGHGERVGGSLALLPQSRTTLGATPRQEQRPRGTLPELRRKERRAAELAQDQIRDLFRIKQKQLGVRRRIAVREAQYEPIVTPHRFHIGTATGTNTPGDGHSPGRVNAAAERGEHADAPIAHFITRALDNDGAVIWNYGGSKFLVSEKADKVLRCLGIEVVLAGQAAQRGVAGHLAKFTDQLADAAAKLERAPGVVPMPEGHLARLARRR